MLDSKGIALASTGVVLTGGMLDVQGVQEFQTPALADLGIKTAFVGAALKTMHECITNKIGKIRGDLIFAAACFGNASIVGSNGDLYATFANATFGIAFISLDALKTGQGFYQKYIQKSSPEL